ncbi:coiled-coil domain-containing protein 12-like [Liolophura sinensis]|uniref:coiled-coil domain-containing protein 12-like n=1 Tax=Liolophura sinensis TaxID=3198878 RepID=UPI003159078B
MASVGSLAEEAQKRKERLKALRNRQNKTPVDGEPPEKKALGDSEWETLPKPVFRSYKPADDSLKESTLPKIKPEDVTEKIKNQLEAGKEEDLAKEIDLTNLAPRKPDWDLKRDVAKKLEKLEKRTQRAIAELIRERLQMGKEDLVSMVNAGAAVAQVEAEDD